MKRTSNYVVTVNNSIVYPISKMYTLAECERICKKWNHESGKSVYKAVKFTTAAGLNK